MADRVDELRRRLQEIGQRVKRLYGAGTKIQEKTQAGRLFRRYMNEGAALEKELDTLQRKSDDQA